jgi:hypothetical protein
MSPDDFGTSMPIQSTGGPISSTLRAHLLRLASLRALKSPGVRVVVALSLSCASAPIAQPLGSSRNPVLCERPKGEREYLHRLRCADGSRPDFCRAGSTDLQHQDHVYDVYLVRCGDVEVEVYMCMYHSGYRESQPIPGFTIVQTDECGDEMMCGGFQLNCE